jgi:hypothetical protein
MYIRTKHIAKNKNMSISKILISCKILVFFEKFLYDKGFKEIKKIISWANWTIQSITVHKIWIINLCHHIFLEKFEYRWQIKKIDQLKFLWVISF